MKLLRLVLTHNREFAINEAVPATVDLDKRKYPL